MKKGFKFGALTLSLVLMGAGLAGCKSEAPKIYKVNYEESTAYTISGVNAAGYKAGETVTFKVAATDKVNYEVKDVKYDETTVELVGDSYSFKMPSKNVTLSATLRTRVHFVYNEAFLRDGMTAEFVLCDGTDPMTGITLSPAAESLAHVTISGKFVTFELGYVGQVTLIAKEAGEEIFRETVSVQRHSKGTVESDPITAAEAKAIGQNLTPSTQSGSYPTEYYYYIRDVVSEITSAYDEGYENLGCYLGENKEFLAYRCVWPKASQASNPIVLGSYITYKCKIINYNDREIEDFTSDKDTEHKAIAVDSTEVRLIRFNVAAKTVKLDTDYDAEVQTYPTTAPVTGTISYTYTTAGIATCTAGVVHADAVGDTNVVANLTIGTRKVTGSIHIYVQEEDVIGEDADHPMTAKQIKAVGSKLARSTPPSTIVASDIVYYVRDIVFEVSEAWTSQYKNATGYLGLEKEFEFYRVTFTEEEAAKLVKGAMIEMSCRIMNAFGNTVENIQGDGTVISLTNTDITFVDVECDGIFHDEIYVKPGEDNAVAISGKAYPEGNNQAVSIVIADSEVATYDATSKKITGVAEGNTTLTVSAGAFEKVYQLHVSATAPKGSEENPLTAEEALALAKALDNNEVTEYEYCVLGVVKKIDSAFSSQYKNMSITYTAGEETFGAYRFKLTEAQSKTVVVGAQVMIRGHVTNFYQEASGSKPARNVYQIDTGGQFVKVVPANA